MRVIYLHVDRISFEPVKRARGVEAEKDASKGASEEALVAFIGVEPEDIKDIEASIEALVEDIVKRAEQVKSRRVVLYPRVHATPTPAPASAAEEIISILRGAEARLKELGYETIRAPFGRYKAFELKVKGHPLAELSSRIKPKKREAKKRERFYVALPDGRVFEISSKEDYEKLLSIPEIAEDKDLRRLIEKEALDMPQEPIEENEIVRHLHKFGFEREPMSDVGHMRYEPEAALIEDLIALYSRNVAEKIGIPVFYVKGTNMFSLEHNAIRKHAELFGERMYELEMDKKRLILRYAACFQQFAIAKDRVISYKHLPFGMLEVADSYRYEQKGEVVLSFRTRKFLMPDLHVFTRDLEEAVKMCHKIQEVIHGEISSIGRSYVAMYNVTDDFRRENKEIVLEFVKRDGRAALIHEIPRGSRYRVINVEYHIIDKYGRPREIATFQIDVGNSERFGINYVDENGEKKNVVIIHTALIGSIIRRIYTLFDTAVQKDYSLPLRLAPIQVRVLPVSDKFVEEARKIALELDSQGIRVELDDRSEKLSRKIRDAEVMRVPYIVIIGQKEIESKILSVRLRNGENKKMSVEELIREIKERTRGYPRLPRRRPMELSKKPQYMRYRSFSMVALLPRKEFIEEYYVKQRFPIEGLYVRHSKTGEILPDVPLVEGIRVEAREVPVEIEERFYDPTVVRELLGPMRDVLREEAKKRRVFTRIAPLCRGLEVGLKVRCERVPYHYVRMIHSNADYVLREEGLFKPTRLRDALRHLMATKRGLVPLNKSKLPNVLSVHVLIVSEDGYGIFVRRSPRLSIAANTLSVIEGYVEACREHDSRTAEDLALIELEDEAGIRGEIYYIGAYRSIRTLGRPMMYFVSLLRESGEEIVKKIEKRASREHSGVEKLKIAERGRDIDELFETLDYSSIEKIARREDASPTVKLLTHMLRFLEKLKIELIEILWSLSRDRARTSLR